MAPIILSMQTLIAGIIWFFFVPKAKWKRLMVNNWLLSWFKKKIKIEKNSCGSDCTINGPYGKLFSLKNMAFSVLLLLSQILITIEEKEKGKWRGNHNALA